MKEERHDYRSRGAAFQRRALLEHLTDCVFHSSPAAA